MSDDVMKHLTVAAPSDDQMDQAESEDFGSSKKKKRKKKISQLGTPLLTHMDRLASFADCGSRDKIIVSSYAAAGFAYAADSGYIYCSMCGLTLSGFIRCDIGTYGDPLSLHQAYRPDCAFLTFKDSRQDITEGHGKELSQIRF